MALTDFEKLFIIDYSTRLLQQDMLTNQLFGSGPVGRSLRSMSLPDVQIKTFTDPTAQALTGKIRAEAGALRQAADNVAHAQPIYELLTKDFETITANVDRMQEILNEVDAGTLSKADGEAEYTALWTEIEDMIPGATYNGMSLLDSDGWTADERITEDVAGVGKFFVQSTTTGGSGLELSLYDQRQYFLDTGNDANPANAGFNFNNAAQRDTIRTALTAIEGDVDNFAAIYEARESQLSSLITTLENHAEILENAAENQTSGSTSAEGLLIDTLLDAIGSIIDENS